MSNNNYSYSSTSYSYASSNTGDGQASGRAYSQEVQHTPSGTTVTNTSQNLGEAAQTQTRRYDAQGRETIGGTTDNAAGRITDAEQAERDRLYEERIEDEYAKREGGA